MPWDAQETFLGWADVRELLKEFLLNNAAALRSVTSPAQWGPQLEVLAHSFCSRKLVNVTGEDGALLPRVHSGMTLAEAVGLGFLSVGSDEHTLTPRSRGEAEGSAARTVVHRLALFNRSEITAMVSQTDIMTHLWMHIDELLEAAVADATVTDLGLVSPSRPRVVCVEPSMPAHVAFAQLFASNVSAAGVVDGDGVLVANLSISDMRRLEPSHFSVLALPVTQFLAHTSGLSDAGGLRAPVAISPTTPFRSLLRLLGGSRPRIHRAYVCEDGRPVGIITPTDILRTLVRLDAEAMDV